MKRTGESQRGVVQLVASILCVGAFFVPLISLPFGLTLSLFDLLSGSLSGGAWLVPRVALLLLFASALVFLVASVRQVFRAGNESVA